MMTGLCEEWQHHIEALANLNMERFAIVGTEGKHDIRGVSRSPSERKVMTIGKAEFKVCCLQANV